MAATTNVTFSTHVDATLPSVFDKLVYGPAPESDNVAKAWIADHDGHFGIFIDNKWVKPTERKTYTTKNPATGEALALTTQGEKEDVEWAVKSSCEAYKSWSALSPHARARHLYSIARHLQKHQRLISVVETLDNGKSIRESRDCDVPTMVRHFYHYAGWAQLMDTEMAKWKSVGVVCGIVPWNFPLMLLTWKVAPALAMGNTVILKPATFTRLSALLFAEICAEAGLPPGVFNVVTGDGRLGSMIATHDKVDKVGFTGSTEVGKILRQATAGTGKKISLELGGKSPIIVFESADLDSTVEGIVDAIWFNQGQVCSAGSRLLAQEPVYECLLSKLRERLTHFRLGDSMDKAIDMGAIVDDSQKQTVEEYVQSARDEGAQVYQASACMPSCGCYYPPTIISGVQTVSRVVTEEIFGPVLVMLPFRTTKEAISLANNTIYGLGASVWTENISLALEVAMNVKAGTVWVNGHNMFDAASGFGGYRQSGYGRDGGKEGLFEYVQPSWKPTAAGSHALKVNVDMKTFGSTVPARPTITETESEKLSVDRTYKMYYGGAQKRPDGQYSRAIYGHDGHVMGHVGDGNRKDIRNAVEAAHKAAPGWGKRAAHNRAQIVYYMAENLEIRHEELSRRIAALTGVTEEQGRAEVDQSIERLFYWGAYCDKYGGTVQETMLYGATIKIHEPVGVIGIACPLVQPLLTFVSLFAPAIVRGNCVVMVPNERHPLLALDLYQIFDTSDLPGGVVNIITGDRDHCTKYLAEHQDVQAMWYFGTAEGSKFVEYSSTGNLKRTWVDYGLPRDWSNPEQGQGEEFLYHSVQVKNIWIPMGDIYAN